MRRALCSYLHRVEISQGGKTRGVSLLCHKKKLGPLRGFRQSLLLGNKTVVLHAINNDHFAEALFPTLILNWVIKSLFQQYVLFRLLHWHHLSCLFRDLDTTLELSVR